MVARPCMQAGSSIRHDSMSPPQPEGPGEAPLSLSLTRLINTWDVGSTTMCNKLIASAAKDSQTFTEEEVRKELRGSVAIAIQKGNANIMLAEYRRAMGVA